MVPTSEVSLPPPRSPHARKHPWSPTSSSVCAKASKPRSSSASSWRTWSSPSAATCCRRSGPASPAAVLVALGFGALLTFGPQGLSFEAQEAIGGTLSIVAVGLITWMIFWMAKTARHMKSGLHHKLDDAIGGGQKAVFVVALLAVGREGLETALFLWAGAQATSGNVPGTTPNAAPLIGAALGLATAVAARLAGLPRRAQAQPAHVLRLDRALPHRRRRRACCPTASTTCRRPASCPA